MAGLTATAALAVPMFFGVPAASAGGCDTVRYGGDNYVLFKNNVKCENARHWVKRLHKTRGDDEPRNFDCASGSNFRDGGQCDHNNRENKFFGWHPGD